MEREESQKGLLSSQKKLISSENIEKHASLDKIQNIDWENAVDFLKLQKENARKIEQNWSSEKRLLENQAQKIRITMSKYKKENEILTKRLRSIKLKNKAMRIKPSNNQGKKALYPLSSRHSKQSSDTNLMRYIQSHQQTKNKIKKSRKQAKKKVNLGNFKKLNTQRGHKKHIRAKSDIPQLGKLFSDNQYGNQQSLGTNMLARLVQIEPLSARNKPISCRNSSKNLKKGLFFNNFFTSNMNANLKAMNFKQQAEMKEFARKEYGRGDTFPIQSQKNLGIYEQKGSRKSQNCLRSRDLKDIFQNFSNDKFKKIMNSQLCKNINILNQRKKRSQKSHISQLSDKGLYQNKLSNQFSLPNSGSGDSISDSCRQNIEKIKQDMMKTKRRRWIQASDTAQPMFENYDNIKIVDNNNLRSLVQTMELGNPLSSRTTLLDPKLTQSAVNLTQNRNLDSLYQNLKSLRNSQKLLKNRENSKKIFKLSKEPRDQKKGHRRVNSREQKVLTSKMKFKVSELNFNNINNSLSKSTVIMTSRSSKKLTLYQSQKIKTAKNFEHFQNIKNLGELKSDIRNSGLGKLNKKSKHAKELHSSKTTREESSLNLKSKKNSSQLSQNILNIQNIGLFQKKNKISTDEYELNNPRNEAQLNIKLSNKQTFKDISLGQKTLRLTNKLQYHLDSVRDVEFLDNDLFISTSMDNTTCLWDMGRLTSKRNSQNLNKNFQANQQLKKKKFSVGNGSVQDNSSKYAKLQHQFKRVTSCRIEPLMLSRDSVYPMLTICSHPHTQKYGFYSGNSGGELKYTTYSHNLRSTASKSIEPETYNLLNLENPIWKIASFKNSNNLLLSVCDTVYVYDIKQNKISSKFDHLRDKYSGNVTDTVTDVKWIDNKLFAAGYISTQSVVIYDANSERKQMINLRSVSCYKNSKKIEDSWIDNVNIQPNCIEVVNRNTLLVGSEDATISFIDLRTGSCVKEFIGHQDSISNLVYSRDSNSFFSSSHDGSIRTWDMKTFRCSDDITAHRKKNHEGVLNMKLSPGGDKLITCGADSFIKIFDVKTELSSQFQNSKGSKIETDRFNHRKVVSARYKRQSKNMDFGG